jgi:anti-anti-sigma factor
MKVKIDTKEKFHVLTIQELILSANMTEELSRELLLFLEKDLKNVVLSLKEVNEIDELAANSLAGIQQKFYDNKASLVMCELHPNVEQYFDKLGLLEMMNVTPTESEAWDIVQLEEIERELLD